MPPRVEVGGETLVWASILLRMSTTMSVMARFIDLKRVLLRETCTAPNFLARICKYVTDIDCRSVFVSFGGLLLYMDGPYNKLVPLRIDYVYLLLKK